MKMDMQVVRDYEARGLITVRAHRDRNALVLNYTPECAYSRAWDAVTRVCRGLVVQADGTVIGNSMPKFFNLGEPEVGTIPDEAPQVWEKADGVLGIIFWDPERREWDVTSRGNPHSPFAEWARAFLPKAYPRFVEMASPYHTYLSEIIFPGSHIVVNYGERQELRLLTVRCTENGEEMYPWLPHAAAIGMPYVRRFLDLEKSTPASRLAEDGKMPNAEGFVLFYPSTGLRVKVKFADYCRLHKATFGLSTKSVWEALRAGDSKQAFLDLFQDPALQAWAAREWQTQLTTFTTLWDAYVAAATSCNVAGGANATAIAKGVWENCEDFALVYNRQHPDGPAMTSGLIMGVIKGKMDFVRDKVWRALKPEFRRPDVLGDLEKEST